MIAKSGHVRKMLVPLLAWVLPIASNAAECDNWQGNHPEWLWCDSFESDTPLGTRYENVSTNGLARTTADAMDGIASLRQIYSPSQVNAGWVIKVKPEGYPDHIYYRWYHKFDAGYASFPPKMARAGYRQRSGSWQAIFMVHSWIKNAAPTLDVRAQNSSQTTTNWLSAAVSDFDLRQSVGEWVSYEVEIKLNTPGESNGLYRLWLNNDLAIERLNVDLRGNTTDKINEVMLDAYWNEGSTGNLTRYYDNFVISSQRIGRTNSPISPPHPPSNFNASSL